MENSNSAPVTVGPDGGEIIAAVGSSYRVLVSGKETNGAFSVIDMKVPPGSGPGPHSHADFYESFYVVEGEVEVYSEAGSYTAKKGSFVLIPTGGLIHNFKNKSAKMAHLTCTVVTAGLEDFFREIGEPANPGEILPAPMDPESIKRLQSAAEKHGQKLYPPNILGNRE